jgi:tetraprenyl-beta-curcumene synthase
MRRPAVKPFQAVGETHLRNGHEPASGLALSTPAPRLAPSDTSSRENLELAVAFAGTVSRYLASVLPAVTRELRHWRAQASEIPDPVLRGLALDALSKRGNMEGAALFAVMAPRTRRGQTVRALVAFQTAYNYLDTLAEQPSPDPVANGRQLHQALLIALDPLAIHPDYYAHHPQRRDGGYLAALVDACRAAFATLPSHSRVAPAALQSATMIVAFQSLNLTAQQGGHEALERWARAQTPNASGLDWWQTAAAAGSSLAVHALIAVAAKPTVDAGEIAGIQNAYFPWICALHSLLDSLVDVGEDDIAGQRNLLSYHPSPQQAAFAMTMLAGRATAAARTLPDGSQHRVILTAMVTYYLSSPEASVLDARAIAEGVADAVGPLLGPALALFRARRLAGRLASGGYR